MHPGSDPFGAPPPGDPFGPPPTVYGGQPSTAGFGMPPGPLGGGPLPQDDYNTLAVLAPIFGLIIPPAGVVLGHLALPQIDRTHQRGRAAAITGLAIGYVLTLALIVGGLWWGTHAGLSTTTASTTSSAVATTTAFEPPSVVTSIAPPTNDPHVKLDLATVPIGACVTLQIRSANSLQDLDLYQADCEHVKGVYVVADRVNSPRNCHSDSVALPPDHSFALCLNPY